MAFTVVVKNSSLLGKVPTVSQLEKGELAVNLVDHKLYCHGYDSQGQDVIFEIGESGDTPSGGTGDRPTGPELGDLFYDTDLDLLFYWNGSEWVPIGQDLELNDLTDVDTSGVQDGMILAYNGAGWVPFDPATFNVQAGRALSYDTGTDPHTLNADIATETNLGVVSVGEGLEVSLLGELSVTPVDVPPGTVVSENAPANPEAGQLWWADTTEEEGGGRLYVWTGDEWVDTSLPGSGSDFDQATANGLYLSKLDNDTAAGEITFEKLTTFEGTTVHASGASLVGNQTALASNVFLCTSPQATFRGASTNPDAYALNASLYQKGDVTDGAAIRIATGASNGFARTSYKGIDITDIKTNTAGETRYGVYSNLGTSPAENYNFYAAGNAPNYFAGETVVNNILASRSELHVQSENPDGSFPGVNNTINGCRLTATGFAGFSTTNDEAFSLNRTGTNGDIIVFRKNGGVKGSIVIDDVTIGSPQLCDYRIKKDITDLTGATDVVKALRPVTFEYTDRAPGVRVDGFVAHEVEEAIPATCRAVYGAKDAVDEEGNPEYQGVDQSKLIPLLTKALQEVMQKNEDLEARIAALEGA